MNLQDLKNTLLRNPAFVREYRKGNIANAVLGARLKASLTQQQLAKRMKTQQSSIARLENGNSRPSLSFLEKVAKALGTELVDPTFLSLQEKLNNRKQKITIVEKPIYHFGFYGDSKTSTNSKNIVHKELIYDIKMLKLNTSSK